MPARAAQYGARVGRAPDRNRPDATQRGYDRKWKRCRAAYLAQYPLCARCLPRVVEAVHVHHKDGQGPKGEQGYDPTNLEALCHSCHSKATVEERRAQARQ